MTSDSYALLNYNKWNRRLLNIYWISNMVILFAEVAICLAFYNGYAKLEGKPEDILPIHYFRDFIFTPSAIILLITILAEALIFLFQKRLSRLQPYVITFSSVALCMVMIVIHFNVYMIYVTCTMPLIFSLVYNDSRVLSYTFFFSLLVFFTLFGFLSGYSDIYRFFNFAEIVTITAILLVTFLLCRLVLGRISEIVGILVEKEHAGYQLEIAKNLAEAKVEARTRFLANISHDIRTPMNGILGLSELGLDYITDTEKQRDYLSKIKKSSEGLLSIIDDILDFSKMDAGELQLETIPFYLSDVLNECETMVKRSAEQKGISFFIQDETGLTGRVWGDPTKLRRVLLNLLSNAVKFTAKGYVSLTIKRGGLGNRIADAISFAIRDSGIGMTQEQMAYIFEPFIQADSSTTRNYGGTGLGLSITKNIIELMGGQIQVNSTLHTGSIFSFAVTLPPSADTQGIPPTADVHSLCYEQPLFAGEALVCEDNEINRQVIVENLEKVGLRVTAVWNGKAGVAAAMSRLENRCPYDIIFMDTQMPVMDGSEATKKLIAAGVSTPIIATTANIMPEDRDKYLKTGMSDCLSKPFKQQALWACLLRHLTPLNLAAGNQPSGKPPKTLPLGEPLDCRLGIENSAGNEILYQKLLHTFLANQRNTYQEIEKALIAQNYTKARHFTHKEMASAATIGAVKLSTLLSGLEEALKTEPPGNPNPWMEGYAQELDKVLQYISEIKYQDTKNK